jgi:biotin transporter BioY
MRVVVPLLPKSLRWTGVVAVAAFIFYASVLTDPPTIAAEGIVGGEDIFRVLTDTVGFAQSQWRHFAAYGVLAYALAYAVERGSPDNNWRWQSALLVVGAAVLYGIGIECVQYFTPERVFDVRDMVANTLGALLVLPWYAVRPVVEVRSLVDYRS